MRMAATGANHDLKLIQFAEHEEHILLVSVAGPQTAVKSLMAALNLDVKLRVILKGLEKFAQWQDYKAVPGQGRYKCTTHRLGYHQIHMTAVLKEERLLTCLSDESLWDAISGPRFTTPVLRAWVPWLRETLTENRQLLALHSFQCSPAVLRATDECLDKLVSSGLQRGVISIPGAEARKEAAVA